MFREKKVKFIAKFVNILKSCRVVVALASNFTTMAPVKTEKIADNLRNGE